MCFSPEFDSADIAGTSRLTHLRTCVIIVRQHHDANQTHNRQVCRSGHVTRKSFRGSNECGPPSRSCVDRFIRGLHRSQEYVTRKLSCILRSSSYTIQTAPPVNIDPEANYGTTARLAAITKPRPPSVPGSSIAYSMNCLLWIDCLEGHCAILCP